MRLIFSQANKHFCVCPPREEGHPRCQWRQLFRKPTKWKTAMLRWWLLQLAAQTSQTPAKKALLPRRLLAPAKLWHFFISVWILQCPAVPPPLCLAPTCTPRPVVPRCWVAPGRGTLVRGQRGYPSSQHTASASSAAATARSPKNVTLATLRDTGLFSLLRAERRGWKLVCCGPGASPAVAPGLACIPRAHVPLPARRTAGPALGGAACPRRRRPEEPRPGSRGSGEAASGHRELPPGPRSAACTRLPSEAPLTCLVPLATTASEEAGEQWGDIGIGSGGQ